MIDVCDTSWTPVSAPLISQASKASQHFKGCNGAGASRLASGWSSQTMLIWLPRGAKAARLARRPPMSSFHHATTTRLASLAAVSSSEDSAISMACTAPCVLSYSATSASRQCNFNQLFPCTAVWPSRHISIRPEKESDIFRLQGQDSKLR